LTAENYNVGGDFDWSPDGKTIVFSHSRSPVANDWTTSDVSIVDVASGRVTAFVKTPAAENSPRFSPDGKSVAVLVSDIRRAGRKAVC
jgi:Tol biopolymer transport system component